MTTSIKHAQKYMGLRPSVRQRIINTITYMSENGGTPVYVTISVDLWEQMIVGMLPVPTELFIEFNEDRIPITPETKLEKQTIFVHGPEKRE